MQELLDQLEQIENIKELMRQACKRNGLNTALAGELTVAKLKLLNERFKKAYATLQDKIKTNWIQNELKTYNWILLAISAIKNVKIAQFTQKLWILLQNIFQFKTRVFLKFEARRFLEEKKSKNKNWSQQQDKLLLKIVNEVQSNDGVKIENREKGENSGMEDFDYSEQLRSVQPTKKDDKKQRVHWNEVARKLFEESHEVYFRSAKHCRERWYNYVDPTIKRGKWNDEEDNKLIELVKVKGNKWAEIATIFNRTEHNVKNRFHSLQIKCKKNSKKNNALKTKKKTNVSDEPKIQIFPPKQENSKAPMITITEFPEKNRSKQPISEIEFGSFLEDADDLPQGSKLQDQSRYAKSELSFFTYSPHNLTPLMGSPSPITFNLKGFAHSQKSFNDAYFKGDSMLSNDKQ